MKPKEIFLQITRNLGNFESVKMGMTYEVEESDIKTVYLFTQIKKELEHSFDSIFKDDVFVEAPKYERKPLILNTVDYDRVKASMVAKRATIEDVEKYYYIDIDVMKELMKLT